MSKYISYLVVFLVCVTFACCKSNEDKLREYVEHKKQTKNYPVQTKRGFWADSVSISSGLIMHFHYRYDKSRKDDFTQEELNLLNFNTKFTVLKLAISDDEEFDWLRSIGVSFNYIFRGIDGDTIINVTVTPDEYREAMKLR